MGPRERGRAGILPSKRLERSETADRDRYVDVVFEGERANNGVAILTSSAFLAARRAPMGRSSPEGRTRFGVDL